MRIAIVDDIKEERTLLHGWLCSQLSRRNLPADIVLLVLPGVDGLNAAEHLHSLFPECGIIWCSDLDFSLHAFRLRVEYFFMEPVNELKIQEGLKAWFRSEKRSFK